MKQHLGRRLDSAGPSIALVAVYRAKFIEILCHHWTPHDAYNHESER